MDYQKNWNSASYFNIKMKDITTMRQPLDRQDKRDRNTTIFWGTQLIPTKVIYLSTTCDMFTKNNPYNEYQITNKDKKGNIIYTHNIVTKEILMFQRSHFFKQIISTYHAINYNNIKYIEYTDDKNNTYYVCINNNTTNIKNARNIMNTLHDHAKSLKLSKNTYLRALFLSEIFICLTTQLWHSSIPNSIHYTNQLVNIIALSASFILKSGLLYDSVFLSMTGYLGKYKKQFYKIPLKSRQFNIQNQNLYFDSYFNIDNSQQNFLSKNYSKDFLIKLVTYFNDSCLLDNTIEKSEWTKNISNEYYTLNNTNAPLGKISNKQIYFNYGFFTLEPHNQTLYLNGLIPNEMGRIYLTHYDTTPQAFILNILNSSMHTIKNISRKTKSETLKQFLIQIKYLKVKGITK